jgi:hypothetical protein
MIDSNHVSVNFAVFIICVDIYILYLHKITYKCIVLYLANELSVWNL